MGLLEVPIAVLEECGLPVRVINMIEERFDAIYIGDMVKIKRMEFLEADGMGLIALTQFEKALEGLIKSWGSIDI